MEITELKKEVKKNRLSLPILMKLSKEIGVIPSAKEEVKKVAILSDFTLKGLGDCLIVKAFSSDIRVDIYDGDYSQWQQEIIGKKLYEFNPDLTFIILDNFGLDNEIFYNFHYSDNEDVKKNIENYLENLYGLIDKLKSENSGKIIISNISSYWCQVMGIMSSKIKSNPRRIISEANIELENRFFNDNQVYIFDYDGWLGHIGKEMNVYGKYYFLGDMRIDPRALPLLSEQLLSYLIPLSSRTKKCLVLDLDNTLWGGIIGEDGIDGIKLSPTGEGKPFYIFQKIISSFSKRGIILAINSKNNEEDVARVFESHPYMILKKENFAAIRTNWQDKATNLRELADEINIGLDSMVFLDDDPTNREMIREMIPEVEVIDLPEDPSLYWKTLLEYTGFSTFEYTEEDKERGRMYFAEKQRRELKSKLIDVDSFLKNLNLEVEIEPVTDFNIHRVAQLTQKTNQFNLTTRRYQEEDMKKMIQEGENIWTLKVVDKFGDYGLTGVIIIKDKKDNWEIDTLLLSCRILGKRIEEQFIQYVLDKIKKKNSKKVIGKYIFTKKNFQVKDFYEKMGFSKKESSDNEDVWELDLKKTNFDLINFIKIK